MDIKVYLSGSIKKGKDDTRKRSYWTDQDMDILKKILSPKYNVCFLNPADRRDDLSDYESALGRDFLQVYISDVVLVDARDEKGIGVGSEMTFAKYNSIPVISVSPSNSQYNRKEFEYLGQRIEHWLHPFVGGLSDYIVESVEEAATLIFNSFPFDNNATKHRDYLYNTMLYYIETQIKNDINMFRIIEKDSTLKEQIKLAKEQLRICP